MVSSVGSVNHVNQSPSVVTAASPAGSTSEQSSLAFFSKGLKSLKSVFPLNKVRAPSTSLTDPSSTSYVNEGSLRSFTGSAISKLSLSSPLTKKLSAYVEKSGSDIEKIQRKAVVKSLKEQGVKIEGDDLVVDQHTKYVQNPTLIIGNNSATSLPEGILSHNPLKLENLPNLNKMPSHLVVYNNTIISNCGNRSIDSGEFYGELRIGKNENLESINLSIKDNVTLRDCPELKTIPQYFPGDLTLVNCPKIETNPESKPVVDGTLHLSEGMAHLQNLFDANAVKINRNIPLVKPVRAQTHTLPTIREVDDSRLS